MSSQLLRSKLNNSLKMRLIQFVRNNVECLGTETKENGDIIQFPTSQIPYKSTLEFLKAGQAAWDGANQYLNSAASKLEIIPRDKVHIIAPITNPGKVVCVGLNYRDHCTEQGVAIPKQPIIFNKFPSSVVGPYDDIQLNQESKAVDWEAELVIVIGKAGKNIKISEAIDHVFGFTVANDVSARDWQLEQNGGQWLLGKTMDTFCPIGPSIVTKDEISDPHSLSIKCRVNGITKQDSSTKELIHNIPALIAHISRFATLLPGDIILTGTPPGVGCFRKPPEYLKSGDTVECQIETIGTIVNKVV